MIERTAPGAAFISCLYIGHRAFHVGQCLLVHSSESIIIPRGLLFFFDQTQLIYLYLTPEERV